MLGHKTSLSNHIRHLFQYNIKKLEIKYKEKTAKKTQHMETKQYTTKQPTDHWRNLRNQKIPEDKLKRKHNAPKSIGHSKSSSKKEVYSDTNLPQETRKLSNKQPNLIPKGTRKRTKKTQS